MTNQATLDLVLRSGNPWTMVRPGTYVNASWGYVRQLTDEEGPLFGRFFYGDTFVRDATADEWARIAGNARALPGAEADLVVTPARDDWGNPMPGCYRVQLNTDSARHFMDVEDSAVVALVFHWADRCPAELRRQAMSAGLTVSNPSVLVR